MFYLVIVCVFVNVSSTVQYSFIIDKEKCSFDIYYNFIDPIMIFDY